MFTSHRLNDGKTTRVGIVWRMSHDPFGNTAVDHAGNWQGARTVVVYYPDTQLTIAVMVNAQVQLFIEETAHLLALAFMDDAAPAQPQEKSNRIIQVTNNRSNGDVETYSGRLVLNEMGAGILEMDTELGWLKSNPIYYLGSGNHYALVTSYGLFYVHLVEEPALQGRMFMYQNRTESNPAEGKPTISFVVN